MQTLYNNLMALCNNPATPFFYSDQTNTPGEFYRIFAYHFTDRDSWLLPDALEARGIMFEIDRAGNPLRIASRPMQKFFNKGEVNFINYGEPTYAMNKVDGSLISSYLDSNGDVQLKSKTSVGSDYANLAMELLRKDQHLMDYIKVAEQNGWTVNLELVSPDPKFRIVIFYSEPKLVILNVRHRESGVYLDTDALPQDYFAGTVDLDALNHLDTLIGAEGYVVIDEFGNWWKEKCMWYLERHRAKDFVNQPLAFTELVLKDEADDVYALIEDQPELVAEMRALQHKIITKANYIVNTVTKYWQDNNHLDRKSYAIKGQEELHPIMFSLAMRYYTDGQEPNWKGNLLERIRKVNWTDANPLAI